MRAKNYIYGFWDRVNTVCIKSGLTKTEIARRMGRNRKICYARDGGMDAMTLGRFCVITGADANWLLGIGGKKDGKTI